MADKEAIAGAVEAAAEVLLAAAGPGEPPPDSGLPQAPGPLTPDPSPADRCAVPGEGSCETATEPLTGRQKAWLALRVVLKRVRFILILLAVGMFIGYWDTVKNYWDKWTRPPVALGKQLATGEEFFCPMDPHVVRSGYEPNGDVPKCPICGMPLSIRKKGEVEKLPAGITGRVQLTPERVQLAGIQTAPVEFRPVSRQTTTVGYVAFDESRLSRVVSRVAGYVEKLYVDKTFALVRQGDPLAEIYSPELYSAAHELILASQRPGLADLAAAARKKLGLLGVSPPEIDQIAASGQASPRLVLRSPQSGYVIQKKIVLGSSVETGMTLLEVADLSAVWVEAEVYEKDIGFLQPGQKIEAAVEAFPNRVFSGRLALIYPQLDTATRTNRVRFELDNPRHELRPGMFATVIINTPLEAIEPFKSLARFRPLSLGERARVRAPGQEREVDVAAFHGNGPHPNPLPKGEGTDGNDPLPEGEGTNGNAPPQAEFLVVPERAVVDSGTKKVVYVEREPGLFEGVEVELGPRVELVAGGRRVDYYPVIKGLRPGDRIAAAGGFLIDAETRLNPAAAATYFGASGGPQSSAPSGPPAAPSAPQGGPRPSHPASPSPASPSAPPRVAVQAPSGEQLEKIAELPEPDRQLALAQKACPVTGKPLGSMGVPYKITLRGQPVFLCCKGCAGKAKREPEETLKRVAQFKGSTER